ncbi:hypothetical protein [Luteolibacter sp. LG18]|uniref:hypothetical protein n=1 Tax=Luteolibacter sp. LG18 TaxID=2819286 RepID=UPI002B2F541E|nr:hypothetical protein llg_33880 [Luteolibacter sp. LG18]
MGSLVFAIVIFIFTVKRSGEFVDFNDDPAMLVEVSPTGLVRLDTYQGQIIAGLADVDWDADQIYSQGVQRLVRTAQRDKVAFSKSMDGRLKIWHETESGATSLNEELNLLFKEKRREKSGVR